MCNKHIRLSKNQRKFSVRNYQRLGITQLFNFYFLILFLDHVFFIFGLKFKELGFIEYVIFNIKDTRINHIKIRIETMVNPENMYPFELTEDIGPWYVPYLCMQQNDIFSIYSLITGILRYMKNEKGREYMHFR